MLGVIVVVVVALMGLCGFALAMIHLGVRNGDRPGDATVSAVLAGSGQPGESRPVVLVSVRNPGDTPLLAGFTARRRRIPGWLDGGTAVRVPRRTARPSLRARAHDVVGVVPAGGDAEFAVAVAGQAGRWYLVTAAIGQAGGRLRVLRFRVTGDQARRVIAPSSSAAGSASSTT